MLASYGSQEDIMKFIGFGNTFRSYKTGGGYFKMTIPDMGADVYMALKDGVMILPTIKIWSLITR
ncbi:MAG: hypothetical protein R2788_10650 [Saprospiraceae bacterium]